MGTNTFICPSCARTVFAESTDPDGRGIGTCTKCGPVVELLADDPRPPIARPPAPEA